MLDAIKRNLLIRYYIAKGRKPWSLGYVEYRANVISRLIEQRDILKLFLNHDRLPEGYGVGIDERCIEYPWVLSRLKEKDIVCLDAGSSLNHEFIFQSNFIKDKKIHVLTLSPEPTRIVDERISYIYGDLRDIPIKDGFYDAIVSISAIEHVGFDNSIFSDNPDFIEDSHNDYVKVLKELWRTLKIGGELFVTLPFGKYEKFPTFQQYDLELLNKFENQIDVPAAEKAFYRYTSDGWVLSDANSCVDSEYFQYCMLTKAERMETTQVSVDGAAAARAVVCLKWMK